MGLPQWSLKLKFVFIQEHVPTKPGAAFRQTLQHQDDSKSEILVWFQKRTIKRM